MYVYSNMPPNCISQWDDKAVNRACNSTSKPRPGDDPAASVRPGQTRQSPIVLTLNVSITLTRSTRDSGYRAKQAGT